MDASDNKMTVRAVDRALDVLLCYIDEKELTLTEISHKVGLNKSTVYVCWAHWRAKDF